MGYRLVFFWMWRNFSGWVFLLGLGFWVLLEFFSFIRFLNTFFVLFLFGCVILVSRGWVDVILIFGIDMFVRV